MVKEDIMLEYEIVGSFLSDESTHVFLDILQIDDFVDTNCKTIIGIMKELKLKSKDVNLYTIANYKKVSIADLGKIQSSVATTANIESRINQLREKSTRIKLIQKLNLAHKMAVDTSNDIAEIQNDVLKEIQDLEIFTDNGYQNLDEAMNQTIELLKKRCNYKDDDSFKTGLPTYDYLTAGLHPEELTIIGARPGVGKTILGMQIGLKIARNNKKVIFTSLEMSTTQLAERIIASETNIDSLNLRSGRINDSQWKEIDKTAARNSLKNFIIDKSSRNPQHIRTKLRKLKPDLLIIDYLQLLQSSQKEQSREREVATITRDLKLMALEFKIPIIILSQLNRNAEGNRPTLGDLRESGAIEQDGDNVVFIFEPNEREKERLIQDGLYTKKMFDDLQKVDKQFVHIVIEKQRNGPLGIFDCVKVPQIMKFIEIERG